MIFAWFLLLFMGQMANECSIKILSPITIKMIPPKTFVFRRKPFPKRIPIIIPEMENIKLVKPIIAILFQIICG